MNMLVIGHWLQSKTWTQEALSADFDQHFGPNVSKQIPFCESCKEGKLYKSPFPSQGRRQAAVPLGLVYRDVHVCS